MLVFSNSRRGAATIRERRLIKRIRYISTMSYTVLQLHRLFKFTYCILAFTFVGLNS